MKQQHRTEEVLTIMFLPSCLTHISVIIMTTDNLVIRNSDLVPVFFNIDTWLIMCRFEAIVSS
eukprot:11530457-Heterocapsa_arctica.AAC.1